MPTLKRCAMLLGLLAFAASLLAPGDVFGQSSTKRAAALQDEFERLYEEGRYADAAASGKLLLPLLEKEFGKESAAVGNWLNSLAEAYRWAHRFAEAEPLYQRSLTIARRVAGPVSQPVATTLNNLGLLYDAQSRYADAERSLKAAVSMAAKLGADRRELHAIASSNLAETYIHMGRLDLAEAQVLADELTTGLAKRAYKL